MKRAVGKKAKKEKKSTAASGWASLTWDDLDRWAGARSVQRGRAYQGQGRVKNLAISDDGRLLATVQGGDRYIVSVSLNAGKKGYEKIESHCTCPVGYNCKHAVAAVAEYLEMLADGTEVAQADKDDLRWSKLAGDDAEYEDDWDDEDDDWDEDEEGNADDDRDADSVRSKTKPSKRSSSPPPRRTRSQWDEKIEQHIRSKSREDLVEQVLSLVERFPELREEYREQVALGEGDVTRLVAQAKREMRERASEIGWQNHWKREGHTPNYDRLQQRLERLVELGRADAVVEIGREFIQLVNAQVEQSNDEGETAMAAAGCFPVIFGAVAKSTQTAPQKLLFAIDACLKDDYSILTDAAGDMLNAKWKPADWSAVADELQRRLAKTVTKGDDGWGVTYRRDQLSDWLVDALKQAGRSSEVLPICEAEARITHNYERLVRHLIAEKRFEEAERWVAEGIEKTREKWPGAASSLAEKMCEVSRSKRQWNMVAAHVACDFFERPSAEDFDELVAAATKAKCGEQVRAAALQFLEHGESPFQWVTSPKKGQVLRVDPAWPLPMPDYLVSLMRPRTRTATPNGPHYRVLLDMAIAAKQPDEALRWYDKLPKAQHRIGIGLGWANEGISVRVAEAVTKSHPERALEIYRHGLDLVLPRADVSAYESAAGYLRRMRPILKSLGRESDWQKMVADIREQHRNRPRFMDVLDKLEGHTILQTRKGRRR